MRKVSNLIRVVILLGLLLLVFVSGCMPGMGGGCSGAQAQGWSSFAPYNELICFGSMEGSVIALNPKARSEGKAFPSETEWIYAIKTATPGSACGAMCAPSSAASGKGIYATPLVIDDLIFEGTYTGKVYALNASRGVVRWIYPREGFETVGAIVGNIITDGKALYFGSANGKIYALDAVTGDFIWEFQTSNKIWTAPVLDNGIIYVGNYGGNVYAIAAETGREVWSIKIPSAVASSLAVKDQLLYFGTFDRNLYAIDKADGTVKWKYLAGNWFWATPVIRGSTIYAACMDNKIYAIEAADGKEVWKFEGDGQMVSTPAVTDNHIFAVSEKGTLYKLDITNGTMISSVSVGYTVYGNPYAEGDMVYIYARDHKVYAVDTVKNHVDWDFSSEIK
ncbi:MAG: PQQ-binding-like beta-propeller repeat protein [Dehalococcoidia bacterium]|nr:PQQ-binding-like beta-propeller repeat protein [Dehalococcoidia bacterium]